MKSLVILMLALLIYTAPLSAQFNVSAGMGIDVASTTALNDYISGFVGVRRADFNTNAEFFGEFGYFLNPELQIGLEYALGVNSFNNAGINYLDISYNMHMPSLLVYYVINGNGYKFKFGGGAGYRYVTLDEKIGGFIPLNFTASGFGIILKAVGNTTLGGNLYADITGLMRLDYTGELKNGNNTMTASNSANTKVDLNQFAVGLRLGLTYYF